MQVAEAVDAVRRAIGKRRIVLERPALFAQARDSDGDADEAGELLECEKNLRAVRPRTGIGDIEVIAPGLGRKAGRTVGRDAVAEYAVHALEIAGFADLVDRIFVAPLAVNQHTHYAASPRTSAAAWRIAAMFARYDSGVRSLNTAEPATSALAPARATSAAFSGVMPPSISISIGRPWARVRTLRELLDGAANEFLAAEARIDGHDQDEINEIDHRLDALDRRSRVHGDAGLLAERADRLQRAVDVGTCLHVHGDDIGAGLGECFQIRIAGRDHQMHVEHFLGVAAQRFHHVRADRDVGHEVAVHHVDMDPVGAGRIDCAYFLAELGEIGGQDRRGDDEWALHLNSSQDINSLVPAEAGTQPIPLEFTPDVIGGGNERELGFTCRAFA